MNPSESEKLSYYQTRPTDSRPMVLLPFYDDGEFKIPFTVRDKIVLLKADAAYSGSYIAQAQLDPGIDIYLPLLDLLVQRVISPHLIYLIQTVVGDVINFGAAIEKYRLILHNERDKLGATTLIATELEFLFQNVRSLYDQLQKIIKVIWDQTSITEPGIKKQALPFKSFGDVILFGQEDQIRSVDEIMGKYGLPIPIATFYNEQGAFFRLCREIRNDIAHYGGKIFSRQPIFPLDDGFAVKVSGRPYSDFDFWNRTEIRNGDLGSVLALISYIINRTISATTNYVIALVSCVQLPEPIGPDWHVFIRHPLLNHLHRLDQYILESWIIV